MFAHYLSFNDLYITVHMWFGIFFVPVNGLAPKLLRRKSFQSFLSARKVKVGKTVSDGELFKYLWSMEELFGHQIGSANHKLVLDDLSDTSANNFCRLSDRSESK